MIIQCFGQTFIKLQIKSPQNGDSYLLIDPYQVKTVGLRQPKMEADLVLSTIGEFDKKLPLPDEALFISGSGEYETKQIFVYGQAETDKENLPTGRTIYMIEAENMTLVHLGNISQTELTDQQLGYMENADVLFVPVGGKDSLNAKQAAHIVQQVDPRVIIPIYYNFPGSRLPLDKVDPFIRELGRTKFDKVDKLRLSRRDLPQEESRLFVINP